MKRLGESIACREYDKVVSKAVATENGLTFELVNDSKLPIAKWKIDNCVLGAKDGSKCDYLMTVADRSSCYWIELKDESMDDACLQIYSTIRNIAEADTYKTHHARIVLGRFTEDRNRIDNVRYINHKKLLNLIGGKDNIKCKNRHLMDKL